MYLLLYFLSDGVLLGLRIKEIGAIAPIEALNVIQKIKTNTSIDEMCTGRALLLKPFCEEILKIRYYEEPNYEKLKSVL